MSAHTMHHHQKTQGYLDAVINTRRDVTWETLLGKIYFSKAHDYTQYTTLLTEAVNTINALPEEDRAEAADLAVYQALAYRPLGGGLTDEDEALWEDPQSFLSWDRITLTNRNPRTGRHTTGPTTEAQNAEREAHRKTSSGETANAPETEGDKTEGSGAGADMDGEADLDTQDTGKDADSTDETGRDTPGHGPWATPDDEPPPF